MDAIDNITEDELVAALSSAQTAGEVADGALTTRALAKRLGRGVRWVREQLRLLADDGKIEPVRAPAVDIAGRVTTVPAYRLKVKRQGGLGDTSSGTDI